MGGFGKSTFLYECLQEKLGKKLEILQDSDSGPWTAVVRGAVYHGLIRSNLSDNLTVSVESRISRYSYGTLVNAMPFDAEMHDRKDRFYCSENQAWLAANQTMWFVNIVSITLPEGTPSKWWMTADALALRRMRPSRPIAHTSSHAGKS